MSNYHLAQLNIARLLAPIDSPQLADFVANLDRINALAEESPGFIWRLKTDEGNATALRPLEDENLIVNMSVWKDVSALNQYVYRSAHLEVMRRRKEWFDRLADAHMVLWWISKGHTPSVEEAMDRLTLLREKGPTPDAFTFRKAFDAPDVIGRADAAGLLVECPG
jgi:hypothetical protein